MRLSPRYQNVNRTAVMLCSQTAVAVGALVAMDFGRASNAPGAGAVSLPCALADAEGGIAAVRVLCSDIEMSPGVYNEEYLAQLRDFLKEMEARGVDAVVVPVMDNVASRIANAKGAGPSIASGDAERFIAAALHTARRIKDCVSVAGFALPDGIASSTQYTDAFIAALAAKHPQYVYFASIPTDDERLIPYGLRENTQIS